MTSCDNNRPDDLCAVTQEDREAGAAIVRWQRTATDGWQAKNPDAIHFFVADFSRAIMQGIWDEHPVVQAFARHRLNATTDQSAEIARLRAALEDAGTRISGLSFAPVFDPESASINGKEVIRARSIGRQMLAALNTKDADR